jgi:hypothetical protein
LRRVCDWGAFDHLHHHLIPPQDEGAQRIALLRDRGRVLSTWSRWQSASRDVMDKILT